MPGLGTVVNVAAVLAGTTLGIFFKGGIPERFRNIIGSAIGISTLMMGIGGVMAGMLSVTQTGLSPGNSMLLILSMLCGGVLGEALRVEERLERLGEFFKRKLVKSDKGETRFVEGFVTASLLFCVGAMTIVGSINDGLLRAPGLLYAKSLMDGIMSVIFGASMGAGVYLAALSVLLYQGGITLLAVFLGDFLSPVMVAQMSFTGSALIFCVGINFLFPGKIKTGNLLPAMFMPLLFSLFGGFF